MIQHIARPHRDLILLRCLVEQLVPRRIDLRIGHREPHTLHDRQRQLERPQLRMLDRRGSRIRDEARHAQPRPIDQTHLDGRLNIGGNGPRRRNAHRQQLGRRESEIAGRSLQDDLVPRQLLDRPDMRLPLERRHFNRRPGGQTENK